MNFTQNTLKTVLLLSVLAMMTACGQVKNEASTDFSSRATPTTVSSATANSLAYCNQNSQNGVTAKAMVYVDTANKIRNDYMKVMLAQVPADFATGSFFQFFRWQAPASGAVYLDPVPVQARFETLDGRVLTGFSPVIYWGQISQIAANSGMSDPNVFLKNVRLVVDLRDPQAQYDVLKVAMYSATNAVLVNMDMLLPAFPVMPSDYALDGGLPRADVLKNLHPFVTQAAQGATAAQLQATANSFCF